MCKTTTLTLIFSSILALAISQPGELKTDPALILWYPFNGNCMDESGHGNHGTVNSATLTTDRYGAPNSAYEFDGIDDFITIVQSPDLIFGCDDFTIITWIYPTAYTGKKGLNAIITKHDYDDQSWLFRVRKHSETGDIPKLNFETDFPTHRYYGNGEVTLNNWHMAAIVRSGDNYTLYLNGNNDGTFTQSECFNTTYPTMISGQGDNCTDERFTGKIDDIMIFRRALTAYEIQLIYQGTGYIALSIKVFLEGPYSGGIMSTFLNGFGFLPLAQPYNAPPWNYSGLESVSTMPTADIVDWVLVELRETTGDVSTATSDSIVGRKAAFLRKDGQVVGPDGFMPLYFNINVMDNLYAVIWHRNHIGIISVLPLTNTAGTYDYDFTDSENKAYGGMMAQHSLEPGVWGMIAGDSDGDGQINNIDKIDYWAVQAGTAGYLSGDFSMNSQVDNFDKVDIWNPNSGTGNFVPDSGIASKSYIPE